MIYYGTRPDIRDEFHATFKTNCLRMKKILVTGGTGYIGSHTVVELQKAGFEVLIIDNLSNSNVEVLNGIASITGIRPTFENLDCLDYVGLDKVLTQHEEIQAIIHFAASKAVGESIEKPLLYYRNNLVSLMNLLQLMPLHKIRHFVFSSSCTVYGQPDELPVSELAPMKPALSPYGNTKQIGEEIIRDIIHTNPSINSIILRYFNPAMIGEWPNGVPNNLIPFVTQTAIGLRKQLSVYGNDYNTPDGSCIRDYISVVDLAKAHVVAMERMLRQKCESNLEVFNIGTGIGVSVLEILKTFQDVNGVSVPYKIVNRRDGDIEKVWANPEKANNVLGWKAQESIEDTLRSAWLWEKRLEEKRKEASRG
jgi:UDP-glucose 4-epimerase